MNMLELQPDPEMKANKTTYVYDQYDRVYLKNYYLGNTGRVRYRGASSLVKGLKAPKKLLYQDIYRYINNTTGQPSKIDRVYQPVISTPVITRNGNDFTVTASVACKSLIIQSGFVYMLSEDELIFNTVYPSASYLTVGYYGGSKRYYTFLPSNQIQKFTGYNGLGTITWTTTQASTVYVKAFCAIETGVLFSKMVTA